MMHILLRINPLCTSYLTCIRTSGFQTTQTDIPHLSLLQKHLAVHLWKYSSSYTFLIPVTQWWVLLGVKL